MKPPPRILPFGVPASAPRPVRRSAESLNSGAFAVRNGLKPGLQTARSRWRWWLWQDAPVAQRSGVSLQTVEPIGPQSSCLEPGPLFVQSQSSRPRRFRSTGMLIPPVLSRIEQPRYPFGLRIDASKIRAFEEIAVNAEKLGRSLAPPEPDPGLNHTQGSERWPK